MAGLPTALAGQIYHAIDFQPCVEATNMKVDYNPPLNFRAGFAGHIGTSKGQAPTMVTLTFATTADRSQFNLILMAKEKRNADRAARNGGKDLGFRYTFWEGDVGISRQWLVPNCKAGQFSQGNDPQQGTGERTIVLMGGEPQQIT